MLRFLSRFDSSAYALLRVGSGVLFAMHGSQKLLGWPPHPQPAPEIPAEMMPLIITAGVIELVGGLLVAIGLLTRPAALLCTALMVAAYFMGHFNAASFPDGWLPILNGGEPALMYFLIFLLIAMRGPGCCSADGMIWKSE